MRSLSSHLGTTSLAQRATAWLTHTGSACEHTPDQEIQRLLRARSEASLAAPIHRCSNPRPSRTDECAAYLGPDLLDSFAFVEAQPKGNRFAAVEHRHGAVQNGGYRAQVFEQFLCSAQHRVCRYDNVVHGGWVCTLRRTEIGVGGGIDLESGVGLGAGGGVGLGIGRCVGRNLDGAVGLGIGLGSVTALGSGRRLGLAVAVGTGGGPFVVVRGCRGRRCYKRERSRSHALRLGLNQRRDLAFEPHFVAVPTLTQKRASAGKETRQRG